jgi:hypothetical protein
LTEGEFEPPVRGSSEPVSDDPLSRDDEDVWDEAKRAIRVTGPLTWLGLAEHVKDAAADHLRIGAGLPLSTDLRRDHLGILSRMALRVSGFTPSHDQSAHEDRYDYPDYDDGPVAHDAGVDLVSVSEDDSGEQETGESEDRITLPLQDVRSVSSGTDTESVNLSILYQDIVNPREREPVRRPPSRPDGRKPRDRGPGDDRGPAGSR